MKRLFLRKWRRDHSEEAQQFELPPGKTSIGRERDNRIVIDDEAASRYHAELSVEGDVVVLMDNGSRNGTLIHGSRVDRQRLAMGDQFAIGETMFELAGSSYSAETVVKPTPDVTPVAEPPRALRSDRKLDRSPPRTEDRGVRREADQKPRRLERPCRLIWKQRESEQWTDCVIDVLPFAIGRAPGNELKFDSTSVSRVHARFELGAQGLDIVDAGSSNGLYVNGRKTERQGLAAGDRIEIGLYNLVFEPRAVELPARPPAPPPRPSLPPTEPGLPAPLRAPPPVPLPPEPVVLRVPSPIAPCQPVAGTSACPRCRVNLPAGAAFCGACGGSLKAAAFCSRCRRPLMGSESFCGDCGAKAR